MSKYLIKALLLILILNVTLSQTTINEETQMYDLFMRFVKEYEKSYTTMAEMMTRFEIFKSNVAKNDLSMDLTSTDIDNDDDLKQGITQFTDLTDDEFQETYLKYQNDTLTNENIELFDAKIDVPHKDSESDENFLSSNLTNTSNGRILQSLTSVPPSWDWRSQGLVTKVKNQGKCGACWAFATIANIEGLYFRKYGQLVDFSEQQLVDCNNTNRGCLGGNVVLALQYLIQSDGIQPRSSYPYKSRKSYCRFQPSLALARVSRYIKSNSDENEIKQMLYLIGPVTATMNANLLKNYRGGILGADSYRCNTFISNHVVTIVGYGTSSTGVPYWIVKNSWGPYWGEKGYFRIARGYGVCGINNYVVSAVLS